MQGWEAEFKEERHFVYKSHMKTIKMIKPGRGHSSHTTKGRVHSMLSKGDATKQMNRTGFAFGGGEMSVIEEYENSTRAI